jgi:hypothetical protein
MAGAAKGEGVETALMIRHIDMYDISGILHLGSRLHRE